MYPFERFTGLGKKALTLAQEEAERAHNTYIGTEHLLLGLMRVEKGTARAILDDSGIEIGAVRKAIESVLGRSERMVVQRIIPTSRVKTVIEIAFEEARGLNQSYVSTGALLLGLIGEGESIGARILTDAGLTADQVREHVALAPPETGQAHL